jgi:hypothetical protein
MSVIEWRRASLTATAGVTIHRSIVLAYALTALAVLGMARVQAQEVEPNEFVPLPAGTNLAVGYYIYGDETKFNFAKGDSFTDKTGLQVNLGAARYIHYSEILGHPAGFEIVQIFGSESGGQIDGQKLGSAFGATNVALAGFIWPYANQADGQYLVVAGWLYPPTGTYDSHSAINIGDYRWRGNVQLGWSHLIGTHFSYDVGFDTMLYGDNDNAFPGGLRLSQDPTYRLQLWANWRWAPSFETSIGYEGFFGGTQSLSGALNGQKTEEQRLRAAASYFITPALQGLLELNHDTNVVGGYKQNFGVTVRVLYAF